MSTVSQAFELARAGKSEAAKQMLWQEFEKLQEREKIVELCEWIATCFENLEEYTQAGNWYESAGELVLAGQGSIFLLRAMQAVKQYEKALECYSRGGDESLIERCEAIIFQLRRSCACA